MFHVIVHKMAVGLYIIVSTVAGVVLTYYQYEAMKKDPIYAGTFVINILVVVVTAIWSYKSFGKDLRSLKRNMIIVIATQHRHDKDLGDVYGHLRDFSGRLQRLDNIETRVERSRGSDLVNLED